MIIVSTNKGEPAVLETNSRAGGAYRRIARRIMGEEVALLDPNDNNSFMNRFKKMIKLAR